MMTCVFIYVCVICIHSDINSDMCLCLGVIEMCCVVCPGVVSSVGICWIILSYVVCVVVSLLVLCANTWLVGGDMCCCVP